MAAKLIITRGLPASGKSTWASQYAEWMAQYEQEIVRIVTMDDIRLAIGAVFALGDESIVQSVRDFTIRQYLRKGYTVISADTNLNQHTFDRVVRLAQLAAEDADLPGDIPVEIQDFTDVDLRVCLLRNQERWAKGDTKVPDSAIRDMYERYIKKS